MEDSITNLILTIVNSLGVIGVGVWLVYKHGKSGVNEIRSEIADAYRERNEQLENHINELEVSLEETNKALIETNKNLSKLQGIVEEKDKQIDRLNKTLLDKNPETLELLQEIRKFLEMLHSKIEASNVELFRQSKMMEVTQKRNERVDNGDYPKEDIVK